MHANILPVTNRLHRNACCPEVYPTTDSAPDSDSYLWEIAQCAHCSQHMGWHFTAGAPELRPQSFWGVCRRSLAVEKRSARSRAGRLSRPASAGAEHALSRLVL